MRGTAEEIYVGRALDLKTKAPPPKKCPLLQGQTPIAYVV